MYAEDGDGNIYNDNSSTEADGETKPSNRPAGQNIASNTRLPGALDNSLEKGDSRELLEQ